MCGQPILYSPELARARPNNGPIMVSLHCYQNTMPSLASQVMLMLTRHFQLSLQQVPAIGH